MKKLIATGLLLTALTLRALAGGITFGGTTGVVGPQGPVGNATNLTAAEIAATGGLTNIPYTVYVATNGSASAAGTANNPVNGLQAAYPLLLAGGHLVVQAGTYNEGIVTNTITIPSPQVIDDWGAIHNFSPACTNCDGTTGAININPSGNTGLVVWNGGAINVTANLSNQDANPIGVTGNFTANGLSVYGDENGIIGYGLPASWSTQRFNYCSIGSGQEGLEQNWSNNLVVYATGCQIYSLHGELGGGAPTNDEPQYAFYASAQGAIGPEIHIQDCTVTVIGTTTNNSAPPNGGTGGIELTAISPLSTIDRTSVYYGSTNTASYALILSASTVVATGNVTLTGFVPVQFYPSAASNMDAYIFGGTSGLHSNAITVSGGTILNSWTNNNRGFVQSINGTKLSNPATLTTFPSIGPGTNWVNNTGRVVDITAGSWAVSVVAGGCFLVGSNITSGLSVSNGVSGVAANEQINLTLSGVQPGESVLFTTNYSGVSASMTWQQAIVQQKKSP